jgi:hypothetical protein
VFLQWAYKQEIFSFFFFEPQFFTCLIKLSLLEKDDPQMHDNFDGTLAAVFFLHINTCLFKCFLLDNTLEQKAQDDSIPIDQFEVHLEQ